MYQIFDHTLISDIPLPELPQGKGVTGTIKVQHNPEMYLDVTGEDWLHEWQGPNGEITIQCVLRDKQYLLRFPGLCDFLITADGKQVQFTPGKDVPEETIRHLLLDQVIPRILCHRGQLVLHASAVQINDQVLLFSGDTGSGKSTIASKFYRDGATLVTDDCILMRFQDKQACCVANYPGLRLYPDSVKALFANENEFCEMAHYSSKKRLVLTNDNTTVRAMPVSAIFLLPEPGEEIHDKVELQRIMGADEMIAIIKQLFLLDVTDKNRIANHFNNIKTLMDRVPVIYRLQYPYEYIRLEEVCTAIQSVMDNK